MTKNKQKIKYFLYARKSSESEDRQIQSIESQINRLKEISKNLNLNIVKIYEESKSAKKPDNRPIFEDMIKRIEAGEAEGILCWQINRLSRNPVDSGRIGWLLQQGILKSIQTIDKEYLPEDNVLVFSVESGVANQFIIDLRKNVKRGIKAQVERGWRPGAAASGYRWIIKKDGGHIIKDPIRFPLIRKMWDLMLQGTYTPTQILDIANNEWGYRTKKTRKIGGNPLSRGSIYNIFADSFYSGEFEYPRGSGNWSKGRHKPMITKAEFDQVQFLLGRKGRPRPKKHKFDFTGIMQCGECGAAITAEEKYKHQKNGNIHHYIYYHCTKRINSKCTQGSIEVKELEKQIDTYLSQISVKKDYAKFAIEYLNRTNEKEVDERKKITKTRQNVHNRCQAQLDNLLKNYISPENTNYSLISPEEFKEQKSKLLKEKSRLKDSIKETDNRADEWMELTEKTFNFCTYARYWFEHGSPEQRKQILYALGSNPLIKDGKLSIHLYDQWNIIKDALDDFPKAKRMLEPPRSGSNKRKTAVLPTDFLTWQARRDSNPQQIALEAIALPIGATRP